MSVISRFKDEWKDVWKDLREIISLRSQLLRSEIIDWISLFFAHVYFLILFSLFLFILLLLAILSFGFYMLEWTNSIGLSLSLSSLLLLFILIIVWKFKYEIILRPSKRFFKRMFRTFSKEVQSQKCSQDN